MQSCCVSAPNLLIVVEVECDFNVEVLFPVTADDYCHCKSSQLTNAQQKKVITDNARVFWKFNVFWSCTLIQFGIASPFMRIESMVTTWKSKMLK